MLQAGDLRERVGFYKRVDLDDGYGNVKGGFDSLPDFVVSANIKPRLGGEQVLAARLTGTTFDNITIRYSEQTAEIDTDWIARNERTGVAYNIRSIVNPDQHKRFLELLCEKGVAIGFIEP